MSTLTVVQQLVASKRDLVAVTHAEKIVDVLHALNSAQLTCVAVYGAPHHWIGAGFVEMIADGKQYIGLVSIVDILSYLSVSGDVATRLQHPIVSVVGSTSESQTLFLEPTSRPIVNVMEQFCKGVHYALAVDDAHSTHPPKMLTQTDLVAFLTAHHPSNSILDSIWQSSAITFATAHAEFVYLDDMVLHVLQTMANVRGYIRAVPVVARDTGLLVTTISASDFRSLTVDTLNLAFHMTIGQFLFELNRGRLPEPCCIDETVSLRTAAQTMLDKKIHRIWVYSGEVISRAGHGSSNIGVLSLTDVIRALYRSGQQF